MNAHSSKNNTTTTVLLVACNTRALDECARVRSTSNSHHNNATHFAQHISTGDLLREEVAQKSPLGIAAQATMKAGGLVR
jgi:hypothetical protein